MQADWLIWANNEKATLYINMPYRRSNQAFTEPLYIYIHYIYFYWHLSHPPKMFYTSARKMKKKEYASFARAKLARFP